MSLQIALCRPDDLLNLRVVGDNLRLDVADPNHPALVPEDSTRESYLTVIFPPQTIAETAAFETAPYPGPPNQPPSTQPDPLSGQTPPLPVPARLGGESRLVFRIKANLETRIPFTFQGLLDWASFELSVTTAADLPEMPTSAQTAAAGAIQKPSATQTAIEMPYRLLLSPSSRVRWQHAEEPVTHRGRTELWHTRLASVLKDKLIELSNTQTAPLRAIWSPDYNPTTPPSMSATDPDFGITAMSASDRHSIVVLTSAFHGYVNEDDSNFLPLPIQAEEFILSPLGGWLKSHGAWDPPYRWHSYFERTRSKSWDDFVLLSGGLERRALKPAEKAQEVAEVSEPRGVFSKRFGLAAEEAKFLIPSRFGYRDKNPLSLSEWRHIATLGRDHYVRIVYEGHLFPFGHRAAMIKVTERQIRDNGGKPLAYLVQHMFIVVREPVKDYTGVPADSYVTSRAPEFKNYERYLPFRRIQLTTLVTPDIANPATAPAHISGTDYSAWVMVNAGGGKLQDFAFQAVAEDIAGNKSEFTASLIFIPFSEAHREPVALTYALSGDRRACVVPEQKITYAPVDPAAATDNTTLVTRALFFEVRAFAFDKKYGGFLPELFRGNVRIPAIEQLLGQPTTTTIAHTQDYRNNGLVNAGGVFAQIVREVAGDAKNPAPKTAADTLPVQFQAKQAGGVATPNMDISCLSRKFGTLAGDVTKAAANEFHPSDFFPPGSATLFGVLDLSGLIKAGLDLATNAPKTQISTEDIPGGKKIVTRLDWNPQVKNLDAGILSFIAQDPETSAETTLAITALLEKPVHFPPAPTVQPNDGTATLSGELKGFTLEFAEVIRINFKSFSFHSENGKKPDVDVSLYSAEPVKFEGDLDFVEKLRDLIPPGLLGDGPSLDINTERIRAGFAIALPPAAVGVFALKDVSLAAALELPFASGKPTFDFAFCERAHPFCLTISLLGGGGFFHLQLDTSGIKQLEVALEFGACAALDIGVASGSVHIMAGIYFGMQTNDKGDLAALLSGYFRAGGELSVLGLVSVSVEFNLSFTYYFDAHKCKGRATLTVTISIAFFSKSIELSVEKSFGKGGGDPTFAQLITAPAVWEDYAGAFA